MLDVAQGELTGETLGEQRLCQGRAVLMPQFVGGCKKKAPEKLWGKGHTCLRKHDEKDEKKEKEEGESSSRGRVENDANACLDQFCRNVNFFQEPI